MSHTTMLLPPAVAISVIIMLLPPNLDFVYKSVPKLILHEDDRKFIFQLGARDYIIFWISKLAG